MNASMRAALVGAVVGLTQFVILCWRGEDIGILDMMGLIITPYALGFLLCRWGRLPRWGAVATAGPAVTAAFLLTLVVSLRFPPSLDLGDWQAGLAFMALGATSYLAAGGLVMPLHVGLRVLTVGLVAVTYIGVASAQSLIVAAARVQTMVDAGYPIMVPDLPDHRLTYLSESGRLLALDYTSDDDFSEIDVTVGAKSLAVAQAACDMDLFGLDEPEGAHCREAAPGVWVRSGAFGTAVVATHGDALLQLVSRTVPEAELIALVPTFRPIDPWALVTLVED
ncbi:hypothetical protein [Nonomuraea zeae]|uniref:Uncharacterized protein n=1 Tax=Nonomuraea zeae TaxID=1642303 RepID=A0A5S4H2Q7_9ACTN|nr:hypothetical protein [Nonomuraea zeae]TMR39001.1 hypothetical protein ETD85_02665 [Nonomuraea zeae]